MDTEQLLQKYDQWNETKKILSLSNPHFLFKDAEIWWAIMGFNVGTEVIGKGSTFRRPVLILKKLSAESCIVIPLTSKESSGSWHIDITFQFVKRWAMLHQIKMIHTRRFQRRIAVLDDKDFIRVKEKLESLLELSLHHHSACAEIGGNIPKVDLLYDSEFENAIAEYNKSIINL